MLDTAGLADVVIAFSPAAHGSGASPNLTAQVDDLRRMMGEAEPARTRVRHGAVRARHERRRPWTGARRC